jgi:hypothetical protein
MTLVLNAKAPQQRGFQEGWTQHENPNQTHIRCRSHRGNHGRTTTLERN